MASYTFRYTSDSVTITVTGISPGTRIRYFLRRSNMTATEQDVVLEASSSPFDFTFYRLASSTGYTINVGIVQTGTYDIVQTYLGAQTFTTSSSGPGGGGGVTPVRPNNWYWWSNIQSGAPIAISANEWNAFCNRINEFRQYKGFYTEYFTTVYSGMPISAGIVNQARNAIYPMNYYVPYPAQTGDAITASFFQELQGALNAVL